MAKKPFMKRLQAQQEMKTLVHRSASVRLI